MNTSMATLSTITTRPPLEDLARFELLAGLPDSLLRRITDEAVLREVPPDETVCMEGQYGRAIFVILSGYVRVSKHSADGPILLGILKRGDFFGELSTLSNQPSAASVTTTTDSLLLEIPRALLQTILDTSPQAQALVDRTYKDRAMRSELGSVSLFEGFSSEELDHLISTATVVRYPKDATIVQEEEEGDAFYLIRSGFVKVTRQRPGKDLVLAYLREGQYFGEMALLHDEKRIASVLAITDTEVIRITKDDFHELLQTHPALRRHLEEVVTRRQARNVALEQDDALQQKLEFVVNEGLMQANTALVIDMEKCIHCDNCSDACAAIHDGYSLLVRHGPQFEQMQFPTSCHHCEDPVCLLGCHFNSMERTPTGAIRIIEETCTGCTLCAQLCPYDTIVMVPRQSETTVGWLGRLLGEKPTPVFVPTSPTGKRYKRLAMQCDLCADRAQMNCVYHCPTGAIFRIKPTDYFVDVESIS